MQKPRLIDPDRWSPYYIYYYYNKPHSNYVGIGDTKIGPIIISVEHPEQVVKKENLRCLVRTKYEDQWVFVPSNSYPKNILKELKQSLDKHSFERDLLVGSVKLTEVKQNEFTKELSAMEARLVPTAYKFGVLYCKKGQTEETQMFSNVETSIEFDEFLTLLGDKIVLKDFQGYRGGLDVKNNTTGTHSIFTKYEGLSIMFHVSTLLPFTKNDDQQIERKRHLGNDVLVIVFKEDDDLPFNPKCVMSEFNHNFIIITPVKSIESTTTHYKMNVITREATKGVEPYLPYPPIFEKGEIFKHFLITKMINCERGAMQAPRFRQRLIQVKEQQMLNAINSVNTSSKQKR